MTRAEQCSRCGLEVLPGELIAELPDNSKAWHEPLVCVARQAERIKVLEEENAALVAQNAALTEAEKLLRDLYVLCVRRDILNAGHNRRIGAALAAIDAARKARARL